MPRKTTPRPRKPAAPEAAGAPPTQTAPVAFPKPDTTWFTGARYGMFIHWGTYSLAARHEWVKRHEGITDDAYLKYFERFDPDLYEPRAWAAKAAAAGMKYVVITAKHHEGFCLWDTAFTDYKSTRTPCGKDLLKPFVEAFREAGLRVGFYYSLLDWHHPDFTVDRHYPRNDKMTAEERAARDKGRDPKRYAQYMRDQVRELLTGYGRLDLMWFDFSYPGENGKGREHWESERLLELVRTLQPHVMVDNRLDLPGEPDFVTPEQYQPFEAPCGADGKPQVWEACQTFSGSWGYHRDEHGWKSVKQLLWMLIDGVSKGGNLLLNVGPNARGEFDARTDARLAGMGAWMRLHERSIRGCGPAPAEFPPPQDGRYTYDPVRRRLYLHLFNWPFKEVFLPGLVGKVAYAQLLNDASEIRFQDPSRMTDFDVNKHAPAGTLCLRLPTEHPPVEVPVVELFLA